jgi:6-phosphogluconolactonase
MSQGPDIVRTAGTGLPGVVVINDDPEGVAQAAAQWLLATAAQRTTRSEEVHVALAGGTTPTRMYELLAGPLRDRADWPRWHIWFGDERAVAPDDPQSNWNLAWTTLLRHVPVNSDYIHRMRGEAEDLAAAAADYHDLMTRLLPPGPHGPRLDIVLLGLGANGHTASLFPGDPSLAVTTALATVGRADYEPYDRITLTLPAINAAAAVAFTVAGESKAAALRDVAAGIVPAARVRPASGQLRWFLDRPAASGLAPAE